MQWERKLINGCKHIFENKRVQRTCLLGVCQKSSRSVVDTPYSILIHFILYSFCYFFFIFTFLITTHCLLSTGTGKKYMVFTRSSLWNCYGTGYTEKRIPGLLNVLSRIHRYSSGAGEFLWPQNGRGFSLNSNNSRWSICERLPTFSLFWTDFVTWEPNQFGWRGGKYSYATNSYATLPICYHDSYVGTTI